MRKDAIDPIHGWVVIAAQGMAGSMRRIVEEVLDAGYPVVVVDNGSNDATFDEALLGGAMVLRTESPENPQAALQSGIDYALGRGAPYVYTFILGGKHADTFEESERIPVFASASILASSWYTYLRS